MAQNENTEKTLRLEIERLREENATLRNRLNGFVCEPQPVYQVKNEELSLEYDPLPKLDNNSPVKEKIHIFKTLFKGREDVYAVHWVNERTGRKGYAPACEDPWASKKDQPKKYLPLTDEVLSAHLKGEKTIGVFPLLKDNTCWFLACDFDKEGWQLDALAYLNVCKRYSVPAYLERSRSGNGGHVWVFFSFPVTAVKARQMGMRLLRLTMDDRADMDLGSYDRFFPSQDFVAPGGFGNLIALPLQKKCRAIEHTEFLDLSNNKFKPFQDQWTFLSSVKRLTTHQLEGLLEIIPPIVLGPSRPVKDSPALRAKHPLPKQIHCELGSSFSIQKSGIPPWMMSKLKHLAFLHNPEFYKNQKMRFSTYRIPQFIKCYKEDFSHIHIPRGLYEEIQGIIHESGSEIICQDQRQVPFPLSLKFHGTLKHEQEKAVKMMLTHETGILVAPPGAGKTVMGCSMIAKRSLPTLILAHLKPLLEQWRKQLISFLDLSSKQIGQVGGGKNKPTQFIDLAMIQSLAKIDDLTQFFSQYGFIVIDECHHIPAASFESCIKQASSRYILGLTATPYRRDGLQDIIMMQCGPVRYKMTETKVSLQNQLIKKETPCELMNDKDMPIQDIFRTLVHHNDRNSLIEQDVLQALKQKKRCLILSHWNEHCQILAEKLRLQGKKPFVLSGKQGKKERKAIIKSIQETNPSDDLVVIATGQYLGEGFDCPCLDTLFLAFPVSFKGKLVQYVGRILREYPSKKDTIVYDYVDSEIPVLKNMFGKRLRTYKSLGYTC